MGLRCCLFPNCFLKHRYTGVYPFLFLNQRTDNLETEVTCMTLFCAFEWKHFSFAYILDMQPIPHFTEQSTSFTQDIA